MDHAFKVNKFNRFLNGIIWWFVLDLYHFPEMSHDDATLQMSPSNVSVASSERRRRQQKLNHDTEIIFVLPSLQMNFKTIHQQGVEEPRDGGTCQGLCEGVHVRGLFQGVCVRGYVSGLCQGVCVMGYMAGG